jgi:hypothetical protein
MRAVDAVARYLWEQGEGLDIYTALLEPPGHLVVREGDYIRVFSPEEVVALANALLALGLMDERGRPLRGAPSVEEVRARRPRGVMPAPSPRGHPGPYDRGQFPGKKDHATFREIPLSRTKGCR